MSRTAASLATIGPLLATALDAIEVGGDPTPWAASGVARRAAATLRNRLADDVCGLIESQGVTGAADTLGVSRETLHAWQREGGWLHKHRDVEADRARVTAAQERGENPLRRAKFVPAGEAVKPRKGGRR
ncbi:MAG: hypothetical protein Q8S73_12650 [Deltaproteobacteria bacterium]|nr:hypothetical protein [Myxococcales bacterium]MDP3214949.1 hypothetical protein [Deltaproteobacteria bacterium]